MNAEAITLDDYLKQYTAQAAAGARAEGERRVDGAITEYDWHAEAFAVLLELVEDGQHFTASDIRIVAGPGPSNGSLGSLLGHAVRDGLIEVAGYTVSTNPSRRQGLVRIWKAKDRAETRSPVPHAPKVPTSPPRGRHGSV